MTFPLAIAQANAPDNRMRIGIVSSVNPFEVNVQGEVVRGPGVIDRSRGFVVGDVVALLRQDQTWLVLGVVFGNTFPQYQSAYVTVSVAAAASATGAVVFARPFANPPAMSINFNANPGPSAGWIIRAVSITTTGFSWFMSGTAATFSMDASWTATERTQ
jgi:hypothetical protein